MKIGLLGLGTVGQAVVSALGANRDGITSLAAEEVEVARALILHPERHARHGSLVTTRPEEILDDPEIGVVVEVMGGMEPARTLIARALSSGRSVVTANKEVMAAHGEELMRAATAAHRDLLFEASVGAGVPVIRAIQMGLAGNSVREVTGILNGTSNFILTAMEMEGLSYQQALDRAREAGYAEADPAADVTGLDAARKIAILGSIAFGTPLHPDAVSTSGIAGLSPADLAAAGRSGHVVKPLAQATWQSGRIGAWAGPALVPKGHPLATVDGIYNAVMVKADPLGDAMFYGPGAGGPSTASAVVGDVIEAVRNLTLGVRSVAPLPYRDLPPLPAGEEEGSFYLRLVSRPGPDALSAVALALAERRIAVRTLTSGEGGGGRAEIVVMTEPCRLADLLDSARTLERGPLVFGRSGPFPAIAVA